MPEERTPEEIATAESEAVAKNDDLTKRLEEMERKQNDPSHIASLHKAHFGEPTPVVVEDTDKKPVFEKLDTEGMSNDQVVAEMDKRREQELAWHERQTDKKFQERDSEALNREQDSAKTKEVQAIQEFVDKTDDFDTHKERVRELYGQPMDIATAFRYAKLDALAQEAEKNPQFRQSLKSTDGDAHDKAIKTFDNVKDGAMSAFDEVTKGVDLNSI